MKYRLLLVAGLVLVIYILLSWEGPGCGDVPPYQPHTSSFQEFLNLWGW
jgi:hypothetical protein